MGTTTKPSKKILQAMEIIGTPERWTKGVSARNSKKQEVRVSDPNAVCFCSLGALNKVNANFSTKEYLAESALKSNFNLESIIDLNDNKQTKHKDVMNMFMTAAFLALSEGE